MDKGKRPSSISWLIVHIFYPLLPFFLEGFIRLIASEFKPSWNIFSGSTLAMSEGLLCIFLNQSLTNTTFPLMNSEKEDEIAMWSTIFTAIAISSFVLFGLIILSETLAVDHQVAIAQQIMNIFKKVAFVLFIFIVPLAVRTQKSFKLRTKL